jgi:hypothetical protein
VIAQTAANALQDTLPTNASTDASATTLSLSGVVATLQLVLAARRAARSADYAHWYRMIYGS